MKKLIYIIGCMLFAWSSLHAQAIADPDKMWTVPAIHTMDEEIAWYFDFASATTLDDNAQLLMWTWQPSEPGVTFPLKNEGDRIWSFTFTPTTFYGLTSEQIYAYSEQKFYFNLQVDGGGGSTGTLSRPIVDFVGDFVKSEKQTSYGPTDFQLNGTLSLLFNANLVDGFLPAPSTVHLHSGLNDWDVEQQFQSWLPEIREKTQFKDLGNGIYKKDFVPETYYGVTEEYLMENIVWTVAKFDGVGDWAGAWDAPKIMAPGVPEPEPPHLYFFPMKISKNDVLIITRENNDRGQRLSYTITGGSKVLTGDLEGAMTRQRAFVNIVGEFGGMDIQKINMLIKDQNGKTIYSGDIPLVEVDNLTK